MHYSFCKSCRALNRYQLNQSKAICGKCQNDLMEVNTVQILEEPELFKLIRNAKLPIVVDVYADWCGPCKTYGPIFEEVARENFESYQFIKVDSEKAMQLAVQYGIRGIPTTLIFKDNMLLKNQSGLLSKDHLISLLQNLPN